MKAANILVGVVLLLFYWFLSIPSFTVDIFGLPLNIPNPFYLLGSISLINILGFQVTIAIIILILSILLILSGIGLLSRKGKK